MSNLLDLDFLVYLATMAGIWGLLSLSLNVQYGMAGLVNLGHVAFFMLGETQGTSAGGADEAGKFLRVPGTNPFFPALHDLQGNERARARPQDLVGRFEEVRRREQLDASVAEMLKREYV